MARRLGMNSNVESYYHEARPGSLSPGHFEKVIPLHNTPQMDWEEALELVAFLPRGWYELSQLSIGDRLEFTQAHWQAKLPYLPRFEEKFSQFFSSLDDVGVFLTKRHLEDHFEVQMVYSLEGEGSFFHGPPPVQEEVKLSAQESFPEDIFPPDYLAFLGIHDGFSKWTDTGLIPMNRLRLSYENLHVYLKERDPILLGDENALDPRSLIPFYESFGLHSYQCFKRDWYPEGKMGNVYFSGADGSVSQPKGNQPSPERQAFPTFLDWLAFYLETFSI